MPKIMIIDEPLTAQFLAKEFLQKGHEVSQCSNGMEAIERYGKDLPQLIITELVLPYATGNEVIASVRKQQKTEVPIVVLSHLYDQQTINHTMELGASVFFTKPYSKKQLVQTIYQLLNNKTKTDA